MAQVVETSDIAIIFSKLKERLLPPPPLSLQIVAVLLGTHCRICCTSVSVEFHIYIKIVLYCSLFFCAAVIEFAFGVLERGMTESEPSICDMSYNM